MLTNNIFISGTMLILGTSTLFMLYMIIEEKYLVKLRTKKHLHKLRYSRHKNIYDKYIKEVNKDK